MLVEKNKLKLKKMHWRSLKICSGFQWVSSRIRKHSNEVINFCAPRVTLYACLPKLNSKFNNFTLQERKYCRDQSKILLRLRKINSDLATILSTFTILVNHLRQKRWIIFNKAACCNMEEHQKFSFRLKFSWVIRKYYINHLLARTQVERKLESVNFSCFLIFDRPTKNPCRTTILGI